MSVKQWQYGMALSVDPQAIRDYQWGFADWLENDTIANAQVEAVNCTAVKRSNTEADVTVRVSEVRVDASVTIQLTTASGQYDNFTIFYNPVDR